LKLGQHERSKDDVETALRHDPQNSYAYRNLGYYHYLRNDAQRATELYHQALEIRQEIDQIHFMMGIAYLAMGEKEKAREEFDRSRAVPEFPVPDYPEC
jgi:type IV pilus assembly protein PilF